MIEKIEKIDFFFTVIYAVLTAVGILLTVYLFRGADQLVRLGGSGLSNLPSGEGAADGYVLLALLFGGGLGFFAGIIAFILGMLCAAVTIVAACVTLVSVSRIKKYRESGNLEFMRKNLKSKVVMNTLVLIITLFLVVQAPIIGIMILFAALSAGEILLIYAFQLCREEME